MIPRSTILRSVRLLVGVLVALVAMTLVDAHAAGAHAEPRRSTPSPDAVVGTGLEEVTITFIGLDPGGPFEIRIINEAGRVVSVGGPVLAGDQTSLLMATEPLAVGTYQVTWTVAAEDDDPSTGDFSFVVEAGSDRAFGMWLLWAVVIGIPAAVFLRPKKKRRSA